MVACLYSQGGGGAARRQRCASLRAVDGRFSVSVMLMEAEFATEVQRVAQRQCCFGKSFELGDPSVEAPRAC